MPGGGGAPAGPEVDVEHQGPIEKSVLRSCVLSLIRSRSFWCSKLDIAIANNVMRLEFSISSSVKRNQLITSH